MALKRDAEDIMDLCSRILTLLRYVNRTELLAEENPDLKFEVTQGQRDAIQAKIDSLQASVKQIAKGW